MIRFPWGHDPVLTLGTYGPSFLKLPLHIRRQEAKAHWHVIGTTGSGKSFFLAQLFLLLYRHGLPVTVIDPHGDLAKLLLIQLVAQGVYRDERAFERIMYLDIPGAERYGLFLPINVLNQAEPEHTIAAKFKEAMHRAFPELAEGAATFDTLLPRAVRVLLANHLPLNALERFFLDVPFRNHLLAGVSDKQIVLYFQHAFSKMRKPEQIHYAGSVLRRAALLTDLPVLRYSLGQAENILQFRRILDEGKSVIVDLSLREEEAAQLFGCLLTVGYEQAARSRSELLPEQRGLSHHLIVDEFANFTTKSEGAFSSMLSHTRKYGLFLVLAHQNWTQASEQLKGALQNVGVEIVFSLERPDAEYTAKMIGRVDPMWVKHEVEDEEALERTHPTFYNLAEQWETLIQSLQDLKQRSFVLKRRGEPARQGRTLDLKTPQVNRKELEQVEQEYLHRYFTPQYLVEKQLARQWHRAPVPGPQSDGGQPVFTQAVTARERLIA